MSRELINRSPDLKALMDDGYEVDIVSGHLVIRNVPYVTPDRQVKRGALVSTLVLAGDVTASPVDHVVMFSGQYPCDRNGDELAKIEYQAMKKEIGPGLVVDHKFSSKPLGGYKDYHEKMTTYAELISSHAAAINPSATARTGRVVESVDPDAVFKYIDTASSRSGITAVSDKLKFNKIAIVGLGGTGSYIPDMVAKTPVQEIHVFDGDDFLQHNAFRSPGPTSIDELRSRPSKVRYHGSRYSLMRTGIIEHGFHLDESNSDKLAGMNFVFLCVDRGDVKGPIIEALERFDIPFIDVGMGIEHVDDQLLGIVRVTTSTPEKRDHVRDKNRIALTGGGEDDIYTQNIQIVELNALNAALAVIKWKKLYGFYSDFKNEMFSAYTLDGNCVLNEDCA